MKSQWSQSLLANISLPTPALSCPSVVSSVSCLPSSSSQCRGNLTERTRPCGVRLYSVQPCLQCRSLSLSCTTLPLKRKQFN